MTIVTTKGEAAEASFPRTTTAPADARAFVVATLTAWGLPGVVDDVRLSVSELVANALAHADGPLIGVRLIVGGGRVRLEVRDGGGGRPIRRSPDAKATRGRGLLLVSAVADGWGVRTEPTGKAVWADFRITSERAA